MGTMLHWAFGFLAVLFAVAFTADYWVDRRGRLSSKVAGATNILVGFIPLATEKLGLDIPEGVTTTYFVIFGASALLAIASVTIYSQATIVRRGQNAGSTCTWVDVLYRGYTAVKNEVDEAIREEAKRQKEVEREVHEAAPEAIAEFLPKFVNDIFVQVPNALPKVKPTDETLESLAATFRATASRMLMAIHQAIPDTYSRFTLRAYDGAGDQMVCICCTDNYYKRPSPIKMSGSNMIARSMELRGTAIYTENKSYHQDTDQRTIIRPDRKYAEYVTQAIGVQIVNGGKERPVFSINMDVWPEYSLSLRYLAKTGFFGLVGKAIENLYSSDMFETKKELLLKELLCTKDH